jgi:hypothetical protein
MPTISANSGGDYCTTDTNFQVVWNVDCSTYVGPASCPSDFDYSVHLNDSNSGFDLFFDQLYVGGGSVCDQDQPTYCGTLTSTNGTYTFTINPMLPVGNYSQTVSMFLPDPGAGESNEEVSDTSPNPGTVQAPGDGKSQSARNVAVDAATYAFSDVITCTWDDPSSADYTYTYSISLVDSSGNEVSGSGCDITPGQHSYTYTIFKFSTDSNCNNPSGMNIQLTEGETYNAKIVTTASIDDVWCVNDGTFTSDSYSGQFTIVECIDSGDCAIAETNLMSDPYARMKYELQCAYADDIEACMANVSGSGGPAYQMDSREIPSTCQAKSGGGKTCARSICPPMSAPYTPNSTTYAGCTVPQATPFPSSIDFSYNGVVNNKAASYYGTYPMNYGYPFIAIIEGGTDPSNSGEPVYNSANYIDLSQTSNKVAVPGTKDGSTIYIMPLAIQDFHPFIAWRTFSAIDNTSNFMPHYGQMYVTYDNGNCQGYMALLYHIGSTRYIDTKGQGSDNKHDKCHATSMDDGVTCDLKLQPMTSIKYDGTADPNGHYHVCSEQPKYDEDKSLAACMTWNIWNNKIDAGFPGHDDANVFTSSPEHNGSCTGSASTTDYSDAANNWNAPIQNTTHRQNMIFFGKDTTAYGVLYHRSNDDENKISHMRLWAIDQNNKYFWTTGLGKGNGRNYTKSDGSAGVYQVLAQQWPNGPPYTLSQRFVTDIKLSAPIQYGLVPYYDQSNFMLEAYTWNTNYSTYEGLGFITGLSSDSFKWGHLNGDIMYTWHIEAHSGGENEITSMYTSIGGTSYYMAYNPGNSDYVQFDLSTAVLNQSRANSQGTIKFWPNGYIYMQLDSSPGKYYWLCVDNTTNVLWWIDMQGNNYPNDFTPLMLAMTWSN